MRRYVLCGCWARLAFLRAREKKALVVAIAKIDEACQSNSCPLTPGALSRWLLWGESRSLARNTAAFRRRFRLQ